MNSFSRCFRRASKPLGPDQVPGLAPVHQRENLESPGIGRTVATLIVALGAVLLAPRAEATNYYVAANGNDTPNAGTSPGAAWQTLTKVNASMGLFQPGDSILFRRGDTFRGSLVVTKAGSAAASIVFGAYGTGAAPVLSGATPLTGWAVWRNGIWRTPVPATGTVTQLFSNQSRANQPQPARHPNTGYFTITDTLNRGPLVGGRKLSNPGSASLTEPTGAWTGARFHARFENWEWFVGNVLNHTYIASKSRLHLDSNPYSNKQGFRLNWGFYLTNKLRALDATHEWYYSPGGDSVYYQPPAGIDPNTLGLEASVTTNVLQINGTGQYLAFVNLALARASTVGVNASFGAHHLTFRNVDVTQAGQVGVQLGYQMRNTSLLNCRVLDSGKLGISTNQNTYVTLDRCEVRRTALVPGLYDKLGPGVSLAGGGHHHAVRYCRIDSTGKHGLDLRDSLSLVEKTTITNSSLVASDVGAIYIISEGARHDTVRQCFFGSTKSFLGAQPSGSKLGVGLYVDDFAEDLVLTNNTVYDNDAMGIHLINGRNCLVTGNVTYGNGDVEMNFQEANARTPPVPIGWSTHHVVRHNLFYSLSVSGTVLRARTQYNGANFGTTNDNLLVNPYTDLLVKIDTKPTPSTSLSEKVTLERWRQYSGGQDSRSRESRWQLTGYTDIVYGATLLNNDFATNAQGWGNSASSTYALTHVATSPLDGGALRATYTGPAGGTSSTFLTSGGRFPLTTNQLYQVEVSLRGTRPVTALKAQVLSSASGSIGFNNDLTLGLVRRNYVRIFRATGTDALSKLTLQMTPDDSECYFDNVRVRAITSATPENARLRNVLLTNPSDASESVSLTGPSFALTGSYFNPDGSQISGNSVMVAPWSSRIVVLGDDLPPATPLPVELTEFTAKPAIGGGADLSWTTASERNSVWFVVERAVDAAGTAFHPIGRVAAQGTSTQAVSYRFRDAAPCPADAGPSATRYYRLRQLDTDSTAHFSPVRPLACAPTGNAVAPLVASPNPATSAFALPGAPAGTLTVTDLCGRVVRTLVLPASAAPVVDLGPVPAGTYLLRLRTAEGALRTGKVQHE